MGSQLVLADLTFFSQTRISCENAEAIQPIITLSRASSQSAT